jgi:glutathione S-transferase
MQLLGNTTSPYVRIARIGLIEKGLDIPNTIVDPWADDTRLRTANVAARVPALILEDGTSLTESLLIVQWLEHTRPAPIHPSLIGPDAAGVLARAGIAMGIIDAAVHTLITRKVTAPVLFDETPVGVRRQRTMAQGMQQLEDMAAGTSMVADLSPRLDTICVITALDYLRFRFPDASWLPALATLDMLSARLRQQHSFAVTMPVNPN